MKVRSVVDSNSSDHVEALLRCYPMRDRYSNINKNKKAQISLSFSAVRTELEVLSDYQLVRFIFKCRYHWGIKF